MLLPLPMPSLLSITSVLCSYMTGRKGSALKHYGKIGQACPAVVSGTDRIICSLFSYLQFIYDMSLCVSLVPLLNFRPLIFCHAMMNR